MHANPRGLILIALACLPPLALPAAEPVPERTCRVLFLNGPADAPRSVQLFDGVTSTAVELPRMNFSPVYKIAGGNTTLRLLKDPPADPKAIEPKAPGVIVAESASDIYLLISQDADNPYLPLRMQVIDASASQLQNGQLMWFNLTPHAIAGQIGSRKLTMPANSRLVLDAPSNKAEDYPVDIYYRRDGDARIYPICETFWRHDPRARGVFFVLATKESPTPRIVGFPDYREPAETGKKDGEAGPPNP